MRAVAALAVLCAVAAGCRATPETPPDDLGVDFGVAGGGDLGDGGADLATADLACGPVGPEVCGNGCDDDGNGYTDDDDPACTSQMLVTLQFGSPALWRLILEPSPHVVVLDGNPIATNGAMATYDGRFAPAAFLAFDSGTKVLERVPLVGGGAATKTSAQYTTRDVCVFNGELIVVSPRTAAGAGDLHRFMADGTTEIMPPVTLASIPTACSSDGTMLYVAEHAAVGPSDIRVFAKSAGGPVDTGTIIAIPDALVGDGYTRLVDLVYVKKSGVFVGLFTTDTGTEGDVMAPFALDGGSGGYIDGGVWHGVGEFMP
jgi:hypothetical protein